MTNKKRTLEYYLKLPWQYEFTYCPEEDSYTVQVEGLMCYSNGKTLEEATKNIQEALQFHIESCLEDNIPIIEPADIAKANGRLNVRTSKAMHLKLIEISQKENVSVSHLINDAIVKQYG